MSPAAAHTAVHPAPFVKTAVHVSAVAVQRSKPASSIPSQFTGTLGPVPPALVPELPVPPVDPEPPEAVAPALVPLLPPVTDVAPEPPFAFASCGSLLSAPHARSTE